MVHALKANPKSHIQEIEGSLIFFSHHPESLHMFTFLFDDIGPTRLHVKFHWKPTCDVKSLLEEEAIRVGGANLSHTTQDLYDTIVTMDPDHEDSFDFVPLLVVLLL
uniref:Catalase core domain-containing protein n=1 Tax=Solanum lycopersicum TaxID=4081 RepID=A0A3Q7ENF8_SOLLC